MDNLHRANVDVLHELDELLDAATAGTVDRGCPELPATIGLTRDARYRYTNEVWALDRDKYTAHLGSNSVSPLCGRRLSSKTYI